MKIRTTTALAAALALLAAGGVQAKLGGPIKIGVISEASAVVGDAAGPAAPVPLHRIESGRRGPYDQPQCFDLDLGSGG